MIHLKELHPDEGLRIFDIKWEVTTAGPSPNNNKRIEVFLLGCKKAMDNNPCKGCFNSPTWDKSIAQFARDPIEVADMINDNCDKDNKYITIGGGEPTDQIDYLIPFVKRLKEHDFHILMYTWRSLKDIMKTPAIELDCINTDNINALFVLEKPIFAVKFKELLKYLDILVDGEFKQDELLWDINNSNTARNFIGSGNQIIWNLNASAYCGYALRNIKDVSLIRIDEDGEKNVLYVTTDIDSSTIETIE